MMATPWFDANAWSWIPGTVLGLLGGLVGALGGWLSPRGKARGLVLGVAWGALVYSIALLAAGVVAKITGQPWGIWYGFMLPGVIGSLVFPFSLMTMRHNYAVKGLKSLKHSPAEDL